jgi:hypothetical protein
MRASKQKKEKGFGSELARVFAPPPWVGRLFAEWEGLGPQHWLRDLAIWIYETETGRPWRPPPPPARVHQQLPPTLPPTPVGAEVIQARHRFQRMLEEQPFNRQAVEQARRQMQASEARRAIALQFDHDGLSTLHKRGRMAEARPRSSGVVEQPADNRKVAGA